MKTLRIWKIEIVSSFPESFSFKIFDKILAHKLTCSSCSLNNDLLNKATLCSWVLGRRPRVTHRCLAPSPHAISGPWVRWLSLVNGSKCQRFQLPAEATGGKHPVQDLGLPSQHLPCKLSWRGSVAPQTRGERTLGIPGVWNLGLRFCQSSVWWLQERAARSLLLQA